MPSLEETRLAGSSAGSTASSGVTAAMSALYTTEVPSADTRAVATLSTAMNADATSLRSIPCASSSATVTATTKKRVPVELTRKGR